MDHKGGVSYSIGKYTAANKNLHGYRYQKNGSGFLVAFRIYHKVKYNALTTETNLSQLTDFLSQEGILDVGENVQKIEKPGEGNMNVVIRLITNKLSFIAKQSRPFVQKYQDIPAPIDRISVEHTFYEAFCKSCPREQGSTA